MAISVRLCSGRTAFEVITGTKIDLIRVSALLKPKVSTKHIVILNYRNREVSIYPSGRMIIKASSKEESLDIAKALLTELDLLHDQKYDKTLKQ